MDEFHWKERKWGGGGLRRLTDLNETFKLNGEAALSFFNVELHHASSVADASLS